MLVESPNLEIYSHNTDGSCVVFLQRSLHRIVICSAFKVQCRRSRRSICRQCCRVQSEVYVVLRLAASLDFPPSFALTVRDHHVPLSKVRPTQLHCGSLKLPCKPIFNVSHFSSRTKAPMLLRSHIHFTLICRSSNTVAHPGIATLPKPTTGSTRPLWR